MTGFKLGDLMTAHYAGAQMDFKVNEVRISAREGDAVYRVSVVTEVQAVASPSPVILAGSNDGESTVWRSTDGGDVFKRAFDLGGSCLSLACAENGYAVAGEWGGGGAFWVSDDGGVSFAETGTAGESRIHVIVRLDNDWLIAGAGTNSVILRSKNNGVTWTRLVDTGDTNASVAVQTNSGAVLVATGNDGDCWRSNDRGDSWANLGTIVAGTPRDLFLASNGDVICLINGDVYVSGDDGDNWTLTQDGGTSIRKGCVAVNGNILVGDADSWIWRSTDHGQNFTQEIQLATDDYWIGKMLTLANGDILAGTQYGPTGFEAGIFKSDDNGVSWTESLVPSGVNAVYALRELA